MSAWVLAIIVTQLAIVGLMIVLAIVVGRGLVLARRALERAEADTTTTAAALRQKLSEQLRASAAGRAGRNH